MSTENTVENLLASQDGSPPTNRLKNWIQCCVGAALIVWLVDLGLSGAFSPFFDSSWTAIAFVSQTVWSGIAFVFHALGAGLAWAFKWVGGKWDWPTYYKLAGFVFLALICGYVKEKSKPTKLKLLWCILVSQYSFVGVILFQLIGRIDVSVGMFFSVIGFIVYLVFPATALLVYADEYATNDAPGAESDRCSEISSAGSYQGSEMSNARKRTDFVANFNLALRSVYTTFPNLPNDGESVNMLVAVNGSDDFFWVRVSNAEGKYTATKI